MNIKIVEKTAHKLQDYQISPENNYKRLKECRDFEISHLWQRSIFLATFFLAIITSYGTFVYHSFVKTTYVEITEIVNNKEVKYFVSSEYYTSNKDFNEFKCWETKKNHTIALFLSTLGIIFSLLWIFMGKGSKFWVESYECAVDFYECDHDNVGSLIQFHPHHGYIDNYKPQDPCPFSTKGYRYSVSKVNIFIGIFSLIFFLGFSGLHLFYLLNTRITDIYFNLAIVILVTATFFMLIYIILAVGCLSTTED